jgi:hypothetical protein
MHSYSINTSERRNIYILTAIISIAISYIIYLCLSKFEIKIPWFIETPSAITIYGILLLIFNKYAWKWRYIKWIFSIKTPNLNGPWTGYIRTDWNNNSIETEAKLEIYQNWTQIKICLYTSNSSSYSKTASIITDDPESYILSYQYFNKPKTGTPSTMEMHFGTSELKIDKNIKELEGDYYSGRGRRSMGYLKFHK